MVARTVMWSICAWMLRAAPTAANDIMMVMTYDKMAEKELDNTKTEQSIHYSTYTYTYT